MEDLIKQASVEDENNLDPFQNSSDKDEGFRRSRSSIAISSIRILTEEEVNKVRAKFEEETEFAYEEALRAHKNIQDTNIPIWIWVLLAWFASDNIAGYLTSPIFFYPMVLLAGVAVILH